MTTQICWQHSRMADLLYGTIQVLCMWTRTSCQKHFWRKIPGTCTWSKLNPLRWLSNLEWNAALMPTPDTWWCVVLNYLLTSFELSYILILRLLSFGSLSFVFSDFGKSPQIVSFLENHCTMRRADGSLCSTMWVLHIVFGRSTAKFVEAHRLLKYPQRAKITWL